MSSELNIPSSNCNLTIDETEEDLEDGEIDDDEEELKSDTKIVEDIPSVEESSKNETSPVKEIPIIDLIDNESEVNVVSTNTTAKAKFKRPNVVEDDFAVNIENAIAAALKKDGIEPPMPKLLEKRSREEESEKYGSNSGYINNNKRKSRKRKKRDAEKDRSNDHNSKRSCQDITFSKNDDCDIDDALMYEMLGIRGGSPPPATSNPSQTTTVVGLPPVLSAYFSDNSYTSYDSYDSDVEYRKKGERRFQRKKERECRDRSSRDRDRERSNRRKNRNSDDDGDDMYNRNNTICLAYIRGQCLNDDCMKKHEGRCERKLELCKFYLKECCAKKEKCLYMHADFPCKYYYLGMECIYKKECKYMHGEPLSETLRNMLLKHIETAPKEILGTFRRISRDYAIQLLNKQHAILCKKYNVENIYAQTLTTQSQPMQIVSNQNNKTSSLLGGKNSSHLLNNILNESNLISSNTHVSVNSNTTVINSITSGIPSLLDMIIPSPNSFEIDSIVSNNAKSSHEINKPRKSRWADTTNSQLQQSSSPNIKNDISNEAVNVPNFLKLQYLNGILRQDQIEKLIQLGVETLQQLTTLSLLQLNAVGLTVSQLNEIQLNTMNLQKLGIFNVDSSNVATKLNVDNVKESPNQTFGGYLKNNQKDSTTPFIIDVKTSTNDVDMRVLPTDVTVQNKMDNVEKTKSLQIEDIGIASPEPQSNDCLLSTERIAVDYSQYLKDSHIDNDKMDLADSEKDDDHKLVIEEDEDQLKIDESAFDIDNEKSNTSYDEGRSTPVGENNFDDNSNSSSKFLPPIISVVFDQVKSKAVVDLSSAVSTMLKAQASGNYSTPQTLNVKKKSSYFQLSDSEKIDTVIENEKNIDKEKEIDLKLKENSISVIKSGLLPVNNFYGSIETKSDTSNQNSSNDPRKKRCPSPIKSPQYKGSTMYERPSIYDGNINDNDISDKIEIRNIADQDMRMSDFIDSSDIDLRLPFKPVTNFTPATEIDGSISSNNTLGYRVVKIEIRKPCYKEIRRSFAVNERTLDPRLRRIFCLKEDLTTSKCFSNSNQTTVYESDSESSHSISSSTIIDATVDTKTTSSIASKEKQTTSLSSARLDPRKRSNENNIQSPSIDSNTISINSQATSSTQAIPNSQINSLSAQQNNDIRMILQKSSWYKNLNSKYKIMINQQLAMVSTQLKKFHQNTTTNKIFDVTFIMQNPTLQQILTNLCIYIDDNGVIQQIDSDSESSENGKSSNIRKVKTNSNNSSNNNNNNDNHNNNNNSNNKNNNSNDNNNNSSNNNNNDNNILPNNVNSNNLHMNNNASFSANISGYQGLGYQGMEYAGGASTLSGGQSKPNQLMSLCNLLDLPSLNTTNSMDFLRGPPPLLQQHQQKKQRQNQQQEENLQEQQELQQNLQQLEQQTKKQHEQVRLKQQHQEQQEQKLFEKNLEQQPKLLNHQEQIQQQRFDSIAAVLSNQINNSSSMHFGGQDMRPALLGVSSGMAFNTQFGGGGVCHRTDTDNIIMPLLSNDSLLGSSQFTGINGENFQNFFNDPRYRNLNINNSNVYNNNNKRFNNLGNFNNDNKNNNNNNRDRRNHNDRSNRDSRNRDKRKI